MSQNEAILKYLQTGESITGLEALRMFGCFRLASRICDLKSKGYDIVKQMVNRNGEWVARYWLSNEES